MLIKAGVDISRLRPEIRKELPYIAKIIWESNEGEMIITSTYEGAHSEGSLHYANLAVDVRKNLSKILSFSRIKKYLGSKYDVVLEADHIHIEYDP